MKHHTPRMSLREVKVQLAAIGATFYQMSKPEVKELPNILFSNETIQSFVLGFYNGGYAMLVATDLRVLFIDVMFFGRLKVEDIPYDMVSSTQLQLGILSATVTVFTRSKEYRFWWVKRDNAQDFHDYVEVQMLRHHSEHLDQELNT